MSLGRLESLRLSREGLLISDKAPSGPSLPVVVGLPGAASRTSFPEGRISLPELPSLVRSGVRKPWVCVTSPCWVRPAIICSFSPRKPSHLPPTTFQHLSLLSLASSSVYICAQWEGAGRNSSIPFWPDQKSNFILRKKEA